MVDNKNKVVPTDGLTGLKENLQADSLSGFLVFLLALPLSLGIAKASEFPPIMGLITAMIGGILVSLIAGSRLTIKGPAAGLIVIVAGSVAELGGGNNELGWHLALGAVVLAGVFQVLFGVFKFGKLADFFPLAAVEGMLAAIGIIILSKQLHVLLGINPVNELTGKPLVEPLELIKLLPHSFINFNASSTIIGVVSLIIIFGMPMIKHPLVKKIPAPLIVLVVTIPLAIMIGLKESNPKGFVHFDKGLFDILAINVSFAGFSQTATFIKYVVMFALVGSLEALLTVKAIDIMDPFKRKSDYNKDLIAIGAGNIFAGVLGGLPMISEVARSSANVNYGGKTRWANFFHGVAILLFLIFATVFSDLIPTSALAAMLIGVGVKLAHPRVFKHMFHIGVEQLIIFIVTIIVTLSTDIGLRDFAVGAIKGQILSAIPSISLVDITHHLSQTNFPQAAYICKNAFVHFPSATIHLILVNVFEYPVTQMLLAKYQQQWIICPDNGILTMITRDKPIELYTIDCTGTSTLLSITSRIAAILPHLLQHADTPTLPLASKLVEKYPLRPT
ncbi:MAG: hypothetical protein EBZ58_01755, partial [Bacteroidetes bacterium]|nr:hypothetical protein [Bacteroidota bacterium]